MTADLARRRAGLPWAAGVSMADDPNTCAYVAREYASRIFDLKGMK